MMHVGFDAWPSPRERDTDSIIRPVFIPGAFSWMDFSVRFRDEGETIAVYVMFNDTRFEASEVAGLADGLIDLLSWLITNPDRPVRQSVS